MPKRPIVIPPVTDVPVLVPIEPPTHDPAQVLRLKRLATMVGSDEQSHLRLISPAISRHHALIVTSGNRAVIRDLASRTRIFINDRPIREAVLRDGDILRIGAGFVFRYIAAPQPPAIHHRAETAVIAIDGNPMERAIEDEVILIGRRYGCDVQLPHESVSTCHAILFEAAGKRYIRDLNSRVGTFVNGQFIRQAEVLFNDRVDIGDSILELQSTEASPLHQTPVAQNIPIEQVSTTPAAQPAAMTTDAGTVAGAASETQPPAPVMPPMESEFAYEGDMDAGASIAGVAVVQGEVVGPGPAAGPETTLDLDQALPQSPAAAAQAPAPMPSDAEFEKTVEEFAGESTGSLVELPPMLPVSRILPTAAAQAPPVAPLTAATDLWKMPAEFAGVIAWNAPMIPPPMPIKMPAPPMVKAPPVQTPPPAIKAPAPVTQVAPPSIWSSTLVPLVEVKPVVEDVKAPPAIEPKPVAEEIIPPSKMELEPVAEELIAPVPVVNDPPEIEAAPVAIEPEPVAEEVVEPAMDFDDLPEVDIAPLEIIQERAAAAPEAIAEEAVELPAIPDEAAAIDISPIDLEIEPPAIEAAPVETNIAPEPVIEEVIETPAARDEMPEIAVTSFVTAFELPASEPEPVAEEISSPVELTSVEPVAQAPIEMSEEPAPVVEPMAVEALDDTATDEEEPIPVLESPNVTHVPPSESIAATVWPPELPEAPAPLPAPFLEPAHVMPAPVAVEPPIMPATRASFAAFAGDIELMQLPEIFGSQELQDETLGSGIEASPTVEMTATSVAEAPVEDRLGEITDKFNGHSRHEFTVEAQEEAVEAPGSSNGKSLHEGNGHSNGESNGESHSESNGENVDEALAEPVAEAEAAVEKFDPSSDVLHGEDLKDSAIESPMVQRNEASGEMTLVPPEPKPVVQIPAEPAKPIAEDAGDIEWPETADAVSGKGLAYLMNEQASGADATPAAEIPWDEPIAASLEARGSAPVEHGPASETAGSGGLADLLAEPETAEPAADEGSNGEWSATIDPAALHVAEDEPADAAAPKPELTDALDDLAVAPAGPPRAVNIPRVVPSNIIVEALDEEDVLDLLSDAPAEPPPAEIPVSQEEALEHEAVENLLSPSTEPVPAEIPVSQDDEIEDEAIANLMSEPAAEAPVAKESRPEAAGDIFSAEARDTFVMPNRVVPPVNPGAARFDFVGEGELPEAASEEVVEHTHAAGIEEDIFEGELAHGAGEDALTPAAGLLGGENVPPIIEADVIDEPAYVPQEIMPAADDLEITELSDTFSGEVSATFTQVPPANDQAATIFPPMWEETAAAETELPAEPLPTAEVNGAAEAPMEDSSGEAPMQGVGLFELGEVNVDQHIGGMPVRLEEAPPPPQPFGKIVVEIPGKSSGKGGSAVLDGRPEMISMTPPPKSQSVRSDPAPRGKTKEEMAAEPKASQADVLAAAPMGLTGGFGNLVGEGVREKDAFSEVEPAVLNDAVFGGSATTHRDDYVLPETPEYSARLAARPEEDFAESDFWDRTDEEEGLPPMGVPRPEETPKTDPLMPLDETGGPADAAPKDPGADPDNENGDAPPQAEPTPEMQAAFMAMLQQPPSRKPPVPPERMIKAPPPAPMRPPVRKTAIGGLMLAMVGSMAVILGAIWLFMPAVSHVNATLTYLNIPYVQGTDDGATLQSTQFKLIEDDQTRQGAINALNQKNPQDTTGFLDVPDLYHRVMLSRQLTAGRGIDGKPQTTLSFNYAGNDAVGDSHRMAALLQAIIVANSETLDDTRRAQDAADRATKETAESQLKIQDLQTQLANLRHSVEAAGTAQTLADLAVKQAKLERAKFDAEDAVDRDKALVTRLQAGAGSGAAANAVAPADPQVDQLRQQLADISAKLEAARNDEGAGLAADRDSLQAAIQQFNDRMTAVNAANMASQVKAYVDAALGAQSQIKSTLGDLLNDGKELERQVGDSRRGVEETVEAKQQQLWNSDPQLQKLQASLAEAQHRYNALIAKGTTDAAKVDPIQKEIDQWTTQIQAEEAALPVDRSQVKVEDALAKVIDELRLKLQAEAAKIDDALSPLDKEYQDISNSVATVATSQQQLLKQIHQSCLLVNDGCHQYRDAAVKTPAVPSQQVMDLQSQMNELQARLDSCQADLAQQAQNNAATPQGRQLSDALQRLYTDRTALDDTQRAYDAVRMQYDDQSSRHHQYEQDQANLAKLTDELNERQTVLDIQIRDRDKKVAEADQSFAIKPVSDSDISATQTDRRLAFSLVAVIGLALVFGILAVRAAQPPVAREMAGPPRAPAL